MTDITNNESIALPKHVAIIMDGNGRWAKERGKIRLNGHRAGIKAVRDAIKVASIKGIERLTLFAFSSENWKRPNEEVSGLMELFAWAMSNEVKSLHENNVKLCVLGDKTRLSKHLQGLINDACLLTKDNTGLILNIAVNYGGRWDIVQAVRKIIENNAEIKPSEINEELITSHLSDSHDVDLLLRTGGEERISNFLLWQLAYSEIYVTDTLWPDFNQKEFEKAIAWFGGRERRFGLTGDQVREGK